MVTNADGNMVVKVTLDPVEYEWLKEQADEELRSPADQLRWILRCVRRDEAENDDAPTINLVMCGCGGSCAASSDVAEVED